MPIDPTPRLFEDNSAAPAKTWRVGTLVYTRSALFNVFFWMLWGDFCLNLMESVIPTLVPRQLAALGASNALIGTITVSILSFMNFVMVPIISTASDRHRGPLGRRMPFMLYPTPLLAFFLIMVGFSTQVARAVLHFYPHALSHFTPQEVTITVIAVLLIGYKFFDLFPQSVYYYLFADCIPQEVMGTFSCLFRVFGTLGGFVFNAYLLRFADTHPAAVYTTSGLLYLVAFLLLCFMVKEGDYPPPEPTGRREGWLGRLRGLRGASVNFVRDCFTLGYYWKFYLMNACFFAGYRPFFAFLQLYSEKTLHMPIARYGQAMGKMMLIQMVVFLSLGPVVDKYHPLRVGIVGNILMFSAPLLSFYFIHGERSFSLFIDFTFVAVAVFMAASGALTPRLFPRQQYGQFCSANAMICQLALLIGAWACGGLIDAAHDYRYIFVWFCGFSAAGSILMILVYRDWKSLGGDEHYVPPAPMSAPSPISELVA